MGELGKKAMEKAEFEWQKEIMKIREEEGSPEGSSAFERWQWKNFLQDKKMEVIMKTSEAYSDGITTGKINTKTNPNLQREWALLNWWKILIERDEI